MFHREKALTTWRDQSSSLASYTPLHFCVPSLCGADLFKRVFPIGVLEFLEKPVCAFVRLADSVVMESVLESSVPVRFVFVLVGPSQSGIDYSQSGRAMGALMADWVRERTKDGEL